ncbi:hypothetical protein B0I35DRAFT_440699 [Stachybotrys elegans]|uniref:Zn(2)-C6 fungal-type domain-containing protein n=1 Tax=Stachybotrys elegans TaxID=80388 RepID=A0A8K0SJP6_9HYPO|nr:hypothetical protein B0I35DRAFT_440699 [Stachybotrys elegans]
MSDNDVKRAGRVCNTCAARKKACDKTLPSCGFCVSRNLTCRYDEPDPTEGRVRSYNPGRYFVPIEYPEADPPTLVAPGNSIGQRVSRLLQRLNTSPEEVKRRYAETARQWPPILHPEAASSSTIDGTSGSVLILSLALLVKFPELPSKEQAIAGAETKISFYNSVKSIFGEAQAIDGISVPLLQAGLLVATHEYISARPSAAFVTIGTCKAMLHILDVPRTRSAAHANHTGQGDAEWLKLKWTMTMLERMIICEMMPLYTQPSTEDPSTLVAQGYNGGISSLQAQAVIFMDQVLLAARWIPVNPALALSRLGELDTAIRDFLTLVVEEDIGESRTLELPAPMPLTLRALFLLHDLIISQIAIHLPLDEQTRTRSWSALDMICRMAMDLATYGTKEHAIPVCCYYNLEAAVEWLKYRTSTCDDGQYGPRIQTLSDMIMYYRNRWMVL